MKIPPSLHFTPISLANIFNIDRRELTDSLRPTEDAGDGYGAQSFHGIPFELGHPRQPNVLLLDNRDVRIEVDSLKASYLIFLHVVEDRPANLVEGLTDFDGMVPRAGDADGNELGQMVSIYSLLYTDGSTAEIPVVRRFAIQQPHITWGASAFMAVPATKLTIFRTGTEQQILNQVAAQTYGRGETRTRSARDSSSTNLWLYAMANPHPEQPIRQILCVPRQERSLIYAISCTNVVDHPLRPGVRRKLRLKLPEAVKLNALNEVEDVDIDLGTVISARAELRYDADRWSSSEPDVQPDQSADTIIVEYVAHPQAKLYLKTGPDSLKVYDLSKIDVGEVTSINPAERPVRLRVVDKGSRQPVAVRLHLHGQAGEYLPPKGHHRQVNPYWFEDNYAEFVNSLNQYSYIPGECLVDLPLGTVYVEISRGYEVAPIRTSFEVTTQTEEITFELDRVLPWRDQGWVTADTHVHFLSPQGCKCRQPAGQPMG
jgi:hypothetical protein